MSRSSQSPEARGDAARASAELQHHEGRTFSGLRSAMEWFFEMGSRLSGPQGLSPRTETAPDGSAFVMSVDGGRGGDIDEVHAVLQTIRQAMQSLAEDELALELVELHYRDGLSMEALAKAKGMGLATASVHLGRGKTFLTVWLRNNGVIRGGSWVGDSRGR